MKSLLLSVTALAAVACGGSDPAPTPIPLAPAIVVRITDPTEGAVVGLTTIQVTGTYAPADFTDDVWLFVFPALAPGRGWHQSGNAPAGLPAERLHAQQHWTVPASLGGPPQSYDLAVFTAPANSATTAALRQYLTDWSRTGDFIGLTQSQIDALSGLVERHRVRIRR